MTTVFEALGIERPTNEFQGRAVEIAQKCLMEQGYTRSCATKDCIKLLEIEDTPENRRIVANVFSIGELVATAESQFGDITRMVQSVAHRAGGDD